MIIFDAHADTIQRICDHGGELRKNSYQIDLERMLESGNSHIQTFAAFINKDEDKLTPFLRCRQLIDTYFAELGKNEDIIIHCNTFKDAEKTINMGKIGSFLFVEGGDALEGKIENLRYFYNRGVRGVTLSWNFSNEICSGIEEVNDKGLSTFGREVVTEMNRLRMVVDISHSSEKTFWDVAEISEKPFCASHSNAKKICSHKRNLTDEQIKEIISREGFIGINFYPPFLCDGKATIKDILNHIEYILAIGGENIIGLGSDFDGIDSTPDGVDGIEDFYMIFDEMRRLGYSDELINKIFYRNFADFIIKNID